MALEARQRDPIRITETIDKSDSVKHYSYKNKSVWAITLKTVQMWLDKNSNSTVPSNYSDVVDRLDNLIDQLNDAYGYVVTKNFYYRNLALKKRTTEMQTIITGLNVIISKESIQNVSFFANLALSEDRITWEPYTDDIKNKVGKLLKKLVILDKDITESYFSANVDNVHSKSKIELALRNKNDTYATQLYTELYNRTKEVVLVSKKIIAF